MNKEPFLKCLYEQRGYFIASEIAEPLWPKSGPFLPQSRTAEIRTVGGTDQTTA